MHSKGLSRPVLLFLTGLAFGISFLIVFMVVTGKWSAIAETFFLYVYDLSQKMVARIPILHG